MKKIDGEPKTLRRLLINTKYTVHYYQREYKWQRKHIEELIDDLTSEFLEYYKSGDVLESVKDYGVYFMGSVVVVGRGNAIIDGQQRFSSLTLLMMYLKNRLTERNESNSAMNDMIFSESSGSVTFNINVDDRIECMTAIYNDELFDTTNANESAKNLYDRYNDIVDVFPKDDISDDMLLLFSNWLIGNVYFIEIVTDNEQDAHKVFMAMNDRGLSLSSTEMLKGYLISEIRNDDTRKELNEVWKEKVYLLKKDDEKADETFVKAWLRAQYANTIRENKAGAENKDFDIIGSAFHKWVRDEHENLGLKTPVDFEHFINRFSKFADIYLQIRNAEKTYSNQTRYIYYNAKLGFSLQPQLLLAPICYEDSNEIIIEKMNLVARFIDLYITSRVTRYSSVDYSTIKNHVFNLTKSIRCCTVEDLKSRLLQQYVNLEYDPATALPELRVNNFTKKYIKSMLARITGYIEEKTDVASNYCNYMDTNTKNPYEVEHIITDHFEWFTEEYNDSEDFKRWRNSFGAVLLLHKSINASLNEKLYADKLDTYRSSEGNIYTESLTQKAYTNNPRFVRFVRDNNLSFKPYATFGKQQITERTQLLVQLVKLVWNTEMFE